MVIYYEEETAAQYRTASDISLISNHNFATHECQNAYRHNAHTVIQKDAFRMFRCGRSIGYLLKPIRTATTEEYQICGYTRNDVSDLLIIHTGKHDILI